MRMKKLVSALAALCITATAAGVNTYAASQLIMESMENESFNQSFAGVSEETVAADYTLSGTWVYGEDSIYQKDDSYKAKGSVKTNASYDLSDKNYWEFEVVAKNQANGYDLHLASNENSGYKVRISRSNVDGTTVHLFNGDEKLISESMSDAWDTKLTFKVIYNNGTLKVTREDAAVLTYNDLDASLFNGQFKVETLAVNRFDLYSMKLTTNTPVDYWVYNEDFENETTASLTEKGWVLQNEATIVSGTDSYLGTSKEAYKDSQASYSPYGYMLTGNYAIRAKQQTGSNPHSTFIRIISGDGSYYGVMPLAVQNGTEARLVKYDASSGTTTVLDTDTSSSVYGVTYNYDIKVYTEADKTKLAADIYMDDSQTPIHLEAIDSDNPITSGKIGIYWGATEIRKLFDFSVYSIVSEDERPAGVTVDKEVFSKTFSSSDTYASLVAEKVDVESGNRDSGKINHYDVTEEASFSDEYGMIYNTGRVYYTYNGTDSDYTFTTNMYKRYNDAGIRFNVSDARDTYYYFENSSRGGDLRGFKLQKVDAAGTTTLASIPLPESEYGVKSYAATGGERYSDYKINCDYQEDGSLKITVTFKAAGYDEYVLTATDSTPLTGNRIEMRLGDQGKIKGFSITKPELDYGVDTDKPVFGVRFYNEDGKALTALEPGMIYANTFAMLLEDYKAVAAIYDGSTLAEVKLIDAADLYENNVELFEAAEGNTVKMFIWNELSGMVPVINAAVAK